ncbi:Exonuclease mut-7-like protein [Drosera capensis]
MRAKIELGEIYGALRDVFVREDVVKLGFRFKQDLVYLSGSFCGEKGCEMGFDRIDPFIDITSIYSFLKQKETGRRVSKQSKSLALICRELLGISLAKELQCSDWSRRPLTEQQKTYAAADARCSLEIFSVFQARIGKEGDAHEVDVPVSTNVRLGLTEILEKTTIRARVIHSKYFGASEMVKAAAPSTNVCVTDVLCSKSTRLDDTLLKIIQKYGTQIVLQESDRKPRASKKKTKRQPRPGVMAKVNNIECSDDWQGPPPWDLSVGGDGCPKFQCDVMVEGLAKHLRCVGTDAAVPYSRKPESRHLIEKKKVLLTRDAKLLRHGYLIRNQNYRVKSLFKNDQLLEVMEIFELKISEDQFMSKCTKCNGRFIQKPLLTEEAAKGFFSKRFQTVYLTKIWSSGNVWILISSTGRYTFSIMPSCLGVDSDNDMHSRLLNPACHFLLLMLFSN